MTKVKFNYKEASCAYIFWHGPASLQYVACQEMACQKIVATHVTLKAGVSAYNEKHDGLIMYRVQDSGLRGQGLNPR